MYLKRLEIQGFKSFASKTILDFLAPKNNHHSITAVVGPNGSGKSNITDAIRWVMGEQAMKNVRAKKNEDVIFNGSETKGQLSAAEVTMVLDNTGGEDMSDYPEITITRRLYRTGESEYVVNNNPTRLLDIHLLLARAKFAEHAYSIISQGMIDRLLTVSPAERKDFFDEASGIKEQQIKQHQASLKLARAEENMRQAETLLAEVEPRLKILHRQVKKLEKRQEVEAELVGVQETYYYTVYKRYHKDRESHELELKKIDENYRAAFEKLEQVQRELADLSRGATRQEVFGDLSNRYQEAVQAVNNLERELAIIDGQLHTEFNSTGHGDVSWLKDKARSVKQEAGQAKSAVEAAAVLARTAHARADEARQKIERLTLDHTQLKLKIGRLQNEMLKNQSERNYREFSGLSAVKAVLEARRQFGGTVHGLVAELGEVDEQYSLALEVTAGGQLASVVVENEIVARHAIEYLRTNRFGVAAFLPLNRIEARGSYGDLDRLLTAPGVIGKAIDLIRFDQKFQNIFSMIFANTLVVKDLKAAEAIGIGRARMVTLDGDLIEYKGVMRGGYRSRGGALRFSSSLPLSNDERVEEIQQEINVENHAKEELERRIEAVKNDLVGEQVNERAAAEKLSILEADFNKRVAEQEKLAHELKLLTASPGEFSAELGRLNTKKETLLKEKTKAATAAEKLNAEIKAFNEQEETKKRRVFSLQESMQTYQHTVNQVMEARSAIQIELAKLSAKEEDLSQEVVHELKISLPSLADRLGQNPPQAGDIAELSGRIEKLKYQLSLIGGIDEEVLKEHTETKTRYDFLTGQLSDLRAASTDLNKMIEELDELMKKKRAVAFKKIRKEFSRYFAILFGGGTADLEEIYGEPEPEILPDGQMPEGQAPLEGVLAEELAPPAKKKSEKILTGIDVTANPPGKKVKYLNMLSGGERTLTSIALICAILHTNPSPFVVLDEVEAALDEANTLRFAKIMAELATQSQFIVVTHNRVTMHAADALYGVVMQADGISKLLSVKIEDVPQYSE